MRPRTVGILVVLGVVGLAGGWYFGPGATPGEQASLPHDALMFPDLAPKLATAAKVQVMHQGKTLTLEKQPDGLWGIASLHDYPVQETKLRSVLTGLTELRLDEARTSDPSQYPRLGVEDPSKPDSAADLLQVLDASGQPIAAVILGHKRVRSQGNTPEEVYVRRPDDPQAWLALGSVTADADAEQWIDRDLLNIPSARIASVVVSDGTLSFARKDGTFTLIQPADHAALDTYKVEDVSRALENLTLMAVKPDADAPHDEVGHATFQTSDGLAIKATVLHAGKEVWARFVASGETKPEVDKLNARLAGWTFEVGNWKEKSLVPTLVDLKAPEPAKPAASSAANPAANPVGNAAADSPAPAIALPSPSAPAADGAKEGKAK